MHPLYQPVQLKSGETIYYDKFNGYVTLEKVVLGNIVRGGILADEMGLGKTVEVLACILVNSNIIASEVSKSECPFPIIQSSKKIETCIKEEKVTIEINTVQETKLNIPKKWIKKTKSANYLALEKWYNETLSVISTVGRKSKNKETSILIQCICGSTSEKNIVSCQYCRKYQHMSCFGYKKSFGPYVCPQCWMDKPLIDCQATLIVTPTSLKTQWCNEISKHVKGPLKVFLYDGYSTSPMYPIDFQNCHIVITTYSVLQNELRLTENLQVS